MTQEQLRITNYLHNVKDENNKSLFEHFCQLHDEYFVEKTNIYTNSADYLDKISQFLKKHSFHYSNPKTSQEVNKPPPENINIYDQNLLQLIQQKIDKINVIMTPIQNDLLNQAGIGFSEMEAYLLQKALKKLASQGNFVSLRFWGKMLANGKDYYVAECQLLINYEEDLPDDTEKVGVGANEYVHYVIQNLVQDQWCLLPPVTRQQLEISRQIKYIFTGDLNRKINSYPKFPGKEKHLLKAQIVRITHANLIAPNGLYKTNDDNPKLIEFAEEFKLQEMSELVNLESWVHVPGNILKMGRTSHYVDPNLNEEVKQQKLDDLANDDPELDRLKSVGEDKPFEPYETEWFIKQIGETQQFTGLDDATVSYGCVILKNYLWPGGLTVCNKNTWINIYIGYGLKNGQAAFVPYSPNDLMEEGDDNEEFPEPNPQTLADELEPDSDDERRRQQELLEQQEQE